MQPEDIECLHEGVECETTDDPEDPDYCPCLCVDCAQ